MSDDRDLWYNLGLAAVLMLLIMLPQVLFRAPLPQKKRE